MEKTTDSSLRNESLKWWDGLPLEKQQDFIYYACQGHKEVFEFDENDILSIYQQETNPKAIIGSGVEEKSVYQLAKTGQYQNRTNVLDKYGKKIFIIEHYADNQSELDQQIIDGLNNYQALRDENEKLKRLIESLTPGGSEFVNDPEHCVQFVKEQINGIPKAILPFKKEATALRNEMESWKKENFDNVEMASETIKQLQNENQALRDSNAELLEALEAAKDDIEGNWDANDEGSSTNKLVAKLQLVINKAKSIK